MNSSTDLPCPDCCAFLNWDSGAFDSVRERAVIFRSLVATIKMQPPLDISLEAKAGKLLGSVIPLDEETADAFLFNLASFSDASLAAFVQSIGVLISSASQIITFAAMAMLDTLILVCSQKTNLALVKADLIPQLINTLNPHSLLFAGAVDINFYLLIIIANPVKLATPFGLAELGIEDRNEQQAVAETVLKQVLVPSEKYIWHLCVNRYSILDWDLEEEFMALLTRLLKISPSHQPTMDSVLNMPVILSIPSCLTFFEKDTSIWSFLGEMVVIQQDWNESREGVQQSWKAMHRMLKMEGIEDVAEAKLLNDHHSTVGRLTVTNSIDWNNQLGMNVPEQE
ncbi:hypothetical protein BLNAU_13397 [Blattamonas nauphoetae]|uniref:Uncharacterized protein n=1 Tax=Blattamonas nauphoetae TaxID=2049346 RepID=A0ABQ9XGS9_9EUKA|nr:hypothetical protein BLNAU_13397 [Blattamonas nauphoetae]